MDPGACGTAAGYQRHYVAGDKPCAPCTAAAAGKSNDINDALRLLAREHPQQLAELTAGLTAAGKTGSGLWKAARSALAREHPHQYKEIRARLTAARLAGRPGEVA